MKNAMKPTIWVRIKKMFLEMSKMTDLDKSMRSKQ